jgi:nucleoside-diphosphate-sugar epimerase
MRVLVTGGAGALGTNVCKLLIETGYKVRIFDLKNARNLNNIQEVEDRVELFWGDITQAESIKRALEQIDIVVHMAAILPPVALQYPQLTQKVNVGGTRILLEAIKQQNPIPLIYTSSVSVFGPTPDAREPLSADRTLPHPVDSYSKTKLMAENIIKQSGLDFVILRLTATPYLTFNVNDLKQMYSIPLNNRVEFCHPYNVAFAIGNTVKNFITINGKTLIISGGTSQRMLYMDMVGSILAVLGLPLPPEKKFTKEPYYLDWYDTSESENLLHFQSRAFADYLDDFAQQLSGRYSKLFLPIMRYFVGPVFGKVITRLM